MNSDEALQPVAYDKGLHYGAVLSLIGLIALGLAWELWLAPLQPGAWKLSLKVIPLLIALPGVLRQKLYTLQWTSMAILLYFTEGIVRATSDHGLSAQLGWLEVALSIVYFLCAIMYVRPYKKQAKNRRAKDDTTTAGKST